jgi:hypothetical protein
MSDRHEYALFSVAPQGRSWIVQLGEQAVSRHPTRDEALGRALALMAAMFRMGLRSGVLEGPKWRPHDPPSA